MTLLSHKTRLGWLRLRLSSFSLHVALMVIGFFYLYPFTWMVGSALKTRNGFFSQGASPLPDAAPQWQNFEEAWVRANFSQYMLNTMFVAVVSALLVILFSSMAAFMLARLRVPGKGIIIGGVTALFLMPKGYTIIPTYEIVQRLGLLNTLWSIVVVLTSGYMLFNTFLFYGFMRNIPNELEEAAIIDGASVWQRYRYVIFPMSIPMAVTVGLFTFLGAWNEFFLSLVFTLGNPDLRPLTVGMYAFIGENTRDWTRLCAAATISVTPVILLFIILQRQFVNALAGAVKS